MRPFRYRDESALSNSLLYAVGGALAGFAAGVLVSHRFGGVTGITNRVRDRFGKGELSGGSDLHALDDVDEADAEYDADFDELGIGASSSRESSEISAEGEELEMRVLNAYQNDPVLCERPVDIGAITDGIVELTGWVNSESEAEHAVTVARGVPGVETVVNRLAVRPREEQFDKYAGRYADGDPVLTESHWEGQSVGTGRRRQGNSSEPDRHADPRPNLEERWTREDAAIAQAADDVGESGRREPPRKSARGGRTDGSPVAPGGVPKSDHVAEPPVNPPEAPTRAD